MHTKSLIAAMTLCSAALTASGSGFSLYEPSTMSTAMGGALVGKAMDASANCNNPATLTDLTNGEVTVGFITEHPRALARGRSGDRFWSDDQCCDPGLFWLPHFQLAVPLPGDFAFGFAASAEYGLGTAYDTNWEMDWSSSDTAVQGYVLNPNLAYKITDKWSVAIGLRWLFFDFEQDCYPQIESSGYELGRAHTRLKGNNSWKSIGFVVGTKYDILDNLSVGVVYKSAIDATIRGKIETHGQRKYSNAISGVAGAAADDGTRQTLLQMGVPRAAWSSYYPAIYPTAYQKALSTINSRMDDGVRAANGDAEADLTLPQSLAAGINWDITPDHHLGFQVSWTQWSKFDSLHFDLAGGDRDVYLNWNDTWRGSLGYRWDFADDWSWMASYVFDQDCCLNKDQGSAMLPPAHRNIVTTGFLWHFYDNFDFCFDYSCIFMDGGSFDTTDKLGKPYHFETCRGFCHAVGCSLTYHF